MTDPSNIIYSHIELHVFRTAFDHLHMIHACSFDCNSHHKGIECKAVSRASVGVMRARSTFSATMYTRFLVVQPM